MPFKTKLQLESVRGTDMYVLLSMLKYFSKEKGITIRTPEGTETNFASIPRIVKPLIDNDDGELRDAATMHDFLYSIKSSNAYPDIDRMAADELLREGMKDLGAGWLKRNVVYSSVVAAGWLHYKKDEVSV